MRLFKRCPRPAPRPVGGTWVRIMSSEYRYLLECEYCATGLTKTVMGKVWAYMVPA